MTYYTRHGIRLVGKQDYLVKFLVVSDGDLKEAAKRLSEAHLATVSLLPVAHPKASP